MGESVAGLESCMKGADRKLGLVPGEPLALGEGARAFCPLLLSPSPWVFFVSWLTSATGCFPCRVCASLQTCSPFLRPREPGLSTEPVRLERKGWCRRNENGRPWRFRPTYGAFSLGVDCKEKSGGGQESSARVFFFNVFCNLKRYIYFGCAGSLLLHASFSPVATTGSCSRVVMRGLLLVVVSPVAEDGLWAYRLQ